MRVALAILCVGAVTFLLCFLIALVKEGMSAPPRAVRAYLAKFHPSRQHGDLIVMDLELQKRTSRAFWVTWSKTAGGSRKTGTA